MRAPETTTSSSSSDIQYGEPPSRAETRADLEDAAFDEITSKRINAPFRFNPPLHRLSRPFRVDFASDDPMFTRRQWRDETGAPSNFPRSWFDDNKFNSLRLGRIVMSDEALGFVNLGEANKRYGFRFLYNPASVSGGMTVNNRIVIDPQSEASLMLQEGFEQIHMELMINRLPDVMGKTARSDYKPGISADDLKYIKEQGTHYDMEFLYRVANGVSTTRNRSDWGDIGILLPNPCHLILGPGTRYYGAIAAVAATDIIFSHHMVPALTTLQITFSRYLHMGSTEDTAAALQAAGVAYEGYTGIGGGLGDDEDGDGTTDADYSGGGEGRVPELDAEQSKNARTIIGVAKSLGVGQRGQIIAIMTAMQESTLYNLNYGDRDSQGLFQQRPSMGWGTVAEVTDPVKASKAFFGRASHTNNPGLLDIQGWQNMRLTEACQAVQRSAFPEAYAKHETLARSVVGHIYRTS